LTGSIREGAVSVGDSLTVECQHGEVPVTVQAIETLDRGPISEARAGQQVGLELKGIRRDQPSRDDRVVRKIPK
jgi:selenocysteine-specific translation elongation factor